MPVHGTGTDPLSRDRSVLSHSPLQLLQVLFEETCVGPVPGLSTLSLVQVRQGGQSLRNEPEFGGQL